MSAPDATATTTLTTATAATDASAAGGGGGGKKRKKEKKKAIEIKLWINQTSYEFGQICTFCQKKQAVFHCAFCPDFYCLACDLTTHKTKKRRDHVRLKISKYDIPTAALKVVYAVRYGQHVKNIQKRCRQKIKRFFDRKTLNHYYWNSVYGTTTWKKPYCLRKEETKPFITAYTGACMIQGMYHMRKARRKACELLLKYYTKVFDRSKGYFYYAFHGKSKLIPKVSWKKPRYCGKGFKFWSFKPIRKAYPFDIIPIYTVDVAALVIQRKWRAILVREYLRTVARATFEQIWDPVYGKWNYFWKEKDILMTRPPLFMRKELWNPFCITEWSEEYVSLFLRRIGLKQYVRSFKDYGVDGKCLTQVDGEDFENMGVMNKVHQKKIMVEMNKIFTIDPKKKGRLTDEHEARREKIRKAKLFYVAAVRVQTIYRGYLGRKELKLLKEIKIVVDGQRAHKEELERRGVWYAERPDLPSYNMPGDKGRGGVNKNKKKTYSNSDVPLVQIHSEGDYQHQPIAFPPIKRFGRNQDHLSIQGWGRRVDDVYVPLLKVKEKPDYSSAFKDGAAIRSSDIASGGGGNDGTKTDLAPSQHELAAIKEKEDQEKLKQLEKGGVKKSTFSTGIEGKFLGDTHPSVMFTEKLIASGYNKRRNQKFLKIAVDPWNPKVFLKNEMKLADRNIDELLL